MQTNPQEKFTTLGLKRNKLGWVIVELTIEDGQIVERIESEPEIRSVVLERFRRQVYLLTTRIT